MKKISIILMAALLACGLVFAASAAQPAKSAKTSKASAQAKAACKSCHADFSSVLPQSHMKVSGNDLAACITCHKPGQPQTEKKNPFSARIHMGHLPPKGKLDCQACHTWSAGRSFRLAGMKESWGKPTKEDLALMKDIFNSWASSEYTDNLHAQAGIACLNCHGKDLPGPDSTVENPKCLECHGPMDQLAKKSEPADFKDRNPHKSHLGEVACTICHKAHGPSKVYCMECHPKFTMKIKGTGKDQQ